MCVVSMVYDWGLNQPKERWIEPSWVKDLQTLLEIAKKYDEENGQPDCELDEKRQVLKKIADEMGIEIKFL